MKQLRRIVFWCHLATGVTVGLVVLTMAATGVMMSFERQIVDWVELRGLDREEARSSASPLTPGELLDAIPDSLGRVTSLTWRSGTGEPVMAAAGRDDAFYLDPDTGLIVGEPNAAIRSFFDGVLGVHRWLAASESVRGFGRSVTGVSNVALLFMVITGVFLWWPRSWKKAALRNTLVFRRGLSRKARRFNRHNVLGIWSALPLIAIAATGVLLSYPSAGDAVFAVYERMADDPSATEVLSADSTHMAAESPDLPGAASVDSTGVIAEFVTLTEMLETTRNRFPGWTTIQLERPAAMEENVVFHVDTGTGGQPQKTAEVTFDRTSGAIVHVTPFGAESAGTRFFEMIQYVHSGEAFGPVGQFVAGLVSLAAVFLVWTGLSLAWMRGMRSIRRRRP